MAARRSLSIVVIGAALASRIAAAEPVSFTSASANTGAVASGWDHTVPVGGQDRYLLIGASIDWTGGSPTVLSASFAGLPLTRLGSAENPGFAHLEIWGLRDPPEGLGLASVRLTANARFTAGAATFTGVDASRSPGPFVWTAGTGTRATVDVPSAASEHVFTVFAAPDGPASLTVEPPQVSRWWMAAGGGSSGPGGATTVAWNLPAAQPWVLGGLTLLPRPTVTDAGSPDADGADGGPAPTPDGSPANDGSGGDRQATDASLDAAATDAPDPGSTDAAPGGTDTTPVRRDLDVRIGCACRTGATAPQAGESLLWCVLAAALTWRKTRQRRRAGTASQELPPDR